ncbi:hypothetical protein BSLA_01r3777 [Burkholderia stabilis]|nr:hypothetical protein BSLA_01r3777 [Burkholderia stabilis]
MSTGDFVFLMHSMPCVGDGYKTSRPRRRPEPPAASRATRHSRGGPDRSACSRTVRRAHQSRAGLPHGSDPRRNSHRPFRLGRNAGCRCGSCCVDKYDRWRRRGKIGVMAVWIKTLGHHGEASWI